MNALKYPRRGLKGGGKYENGLGMGRRPKSMVFLFTRPGEPSGLRAQ